MQPATPRLPFYRSLYIQVLAAILIGVLIGHFAPDTGVALKPLGDGFIKLIKMIIAPIIFCTVVVGIAGMEDMKKVGKTGGLALLYFEIVSTLALVIGLVVINLVNNAYLHAFENIPSGLLNVRAHASASRVHMVVSDNGNGIEPDNMSRLFEPFFSTKIGQGGTGLGLAIVHNLVVKTLGGEIRVSSVPGQGTQFDIELPQTLA